jgi:ComEC/Rec2-related protein
MQVVPVDTLAAVMGEVRGQSTVRSARLRLASTFALLVVGMAIVREIESVRTFTSSRLPWWFIAACVLSLLVLAVRGRVLRGALLGTAVLLFGSAWWVVRSEPGMGTLAAVLAASSRDAARSSPVVLTVEGRILTRPESGPEGKSTLASYIAYTPSARFELAVHRVRTDAGWLDAAGTLLVRVSGVDGVERSTITTETGSPGAGDIAMLTGIARGIEAPLNPGGVDSSAWAQQRGVAGYLSIEDPRLIERIPHHQDTSIGRAWGGLLRWRGELMLAASRTLEPPPSLKHAGLPNSPASIRVHEVSALIHSLVLGLDERHEEQVQRRFTRLGVVHVLAISGYHVAVLAGVIASAVRATGDRGRFEAILVITGIVLYVLLVPASAPVIRAAVCVAFLYVGRIFARRYDPLCLLLIAGIVLALWRPSEVFTLGYILSLGLCILLVAAGRRVHARLAGPQLRGLVRPRKSMLGEMNNFAARFATATLLCWTVSTPIIAWWTGWCSPITIFASVLVVPLVSLLLVLGIVQVIAILAVQWSIGWLAPAAPDALQALGSHVLYAGGGFILWIVDLVDAIPLGSLRLFPISLALAIAATILLLAWLLRGRTNHRALWLATVLIAAWWTSEFFLAARSMGLERDESIRADVFAVGDGLCTSLRARSDSGTTPILIGAGSGRANLGVREVPAALRAVGAWRASTAIVLGPEPRHFMFIPELVEHLSIDRVLLPASLREIANQDRLSPQAGLIAHLEQHDVTIDWVDAPTRIEFGPEHIIELEPAERSLRASLAERDAGKQTRPLLSIHHEAGRDTGDAQVMIVAAQAASAGGLERILRQSDARHVIVSSAAEPAGSAASDPRIHWTSRDGYTAIRIGTSGAITRTTLDRAR